MAPNVEFLRQYYEYVIWADLRQLASVRRVPEAEYFKDRGFSFGSMHRLLLHELAAQSIWLDRFERVQPVWLMDDAEIRTLSDIESRWPRAHERGRGFFAAVSQEQLEAPLDYVNLRGDSVSLPLWQPMFQMCQHAYYHRGQLNSMIRLAGGEPAVVDFQIWAIEQNKGTRA